MNDLTIDYKEWKARKKPFGISGCFRLRNESQFMERSIRSHLPYLDECVLVVQPSEDDTLEIAKRLAAEDERVRVYEYDIIPDWIDTPGFYEKDPDQPGHLVHMSNWALSKCTYSWICKVEGDVIALPSIHHIVDAIFVNPHETHYYGRLILNVAGENEDMISVDNPRNAGWDEAFFNNDPDKFRFVRAGKWETVPMGPVATCMGFSALHMKRCKVGKVGWNGEKYAEFTKETVERVMQAFSAKSPWPHTPHGMHMDALFEAVPNV